MKDNLDFNGIEPTVRHWMEKTFPPNKFEHAEAYVALRGLDTVFYDQGKDSGSDWQPSLIVRGMGRTDSKILHCAKELQTTSLAYINHALRQALTRKTVLQVNVPSTQIKDSGLESRTELQHEMTELPEDLREDLINASMIDPRRTYIGYFNALESFLFLNSAGANISGTKRYFRIDFQHGTRGNLVRRCLGFSPENGQELSEVRRLIPYLKDITPSQDIRASKDITDVSHELTKIAKQIDASKKGRVSSGLCNVVMPVDIFFHECVVHSLENSPELSYSSANTRGIGRSPVFNTNQQLGHDITIKDSPNLKIAGLNPIGHMKIDDEGFNMRTKKLLDNGRVTKNRLCSKYSLGKLQGNGRVSDTFGIAQSRMSLTEVDSSQDGANNVEELLEQCDNTHPTIICVNNVGVSKNLTGVFNLGVNNDNDISEASPESYVVDKDGWHPIKHPSLLVGMMYSTLRSMILSGEKLVSYNTGTCGKTHPLDKDNEDEVLVGMKAPMAIIPELQFRPLVQTAPNI
jgi:predicted Zn-dependent protease